jgi:phage-related protein
MPSIGPRCHELRITDGERRAEWRVIYRLDADAVVIGDVFQKTTRATPAHVIENCRRRYRTYDST